MNKITQGEQLPWNKSICSRIFKPSNDQLAGAIWAHVQLAGMENEKKCDIKIFEKNPKQSILLQINEDASTQRPNTEGATNMSGVSSNNESSRMDGCSTNLSHLHSSSKVTRTFT